MHLPCDLSIYLHTQVLLPRAERAELRDAPLRFPSMAEMIESMNPSSSPSVTPLSFQPAGSSSSTCTAEPVELQHLQPQVS
jgi:hypothetical protein